MERGKYIVLEGPEGGGKSTQMRFLENYFTENSIPYEKVREPGGTEFGEELRSILKHSKNDINPKAEALLLNAGRSQLVNEKIIPALNEGKHVISDRCYYSTLTLQGFGAGVDLEKLNYINNFAMEGKKPDLAIILDIPPEDGLEREVEGGRFTDKGKEHHENVRKGYLYIAENFPEAVKIDVKDKKPEEVYNEMMKIIKERLNI